MPPGWAHRSALAGVIGPDAMIPESEFSFGFFYMSADTYYPHHWHQAEELYLALGGVTSFEIDGINTTLRPGDVSITPPMASHAITAGELGVLLLWGWRGDISYDSYAY
ncbi:MAG: cupin domain-containing protein [Actinomycetia bacterium]|nr:cupin domain-containing protein [Actinomycetes bacterium]